MLMDNKIKQLQKSFELRAEIADMMWEIDRLKEVEQEYVDEEMYEKASIILARQKRLTRLIKNREKKLKQYDDTL
jgi:RecA/RadA recombinase